MNDFNTMIKALKVAWIPRLQSKTDASWKIIPETAKWLPIKDSFVDIKISPTNLVFELIIQKNFYFQTRLVGLI